jgi:Uma2 family endonuclease
MVQPAARSSAFTYADYCTWPEDARWELIEGAAYAMAPAPATAHQLLLVELVRQVANFLLDRPCRVVTAPFDVRLPEADETDDQTRTVLQPDLAVICDLAKLDARGCRGAPDWVVEVLSPGTAARDMIQKRRLYERHGVREYWLVHPTDRVVTLYRRTGEGFGMPDIQATDATTGVSILPGLAIDWALAFRS